MRHQVADPLRIVVVAPPYYEIPPVRYGGVERVCFTLAEQLVDLGHHVTVIGVGPRHTTADFVATLPAAPGELVHNAVATEAQHSLIAADVIRRLRPDIVHDHTMSGLLTATGHPCPTVATVHAALAGPESLVDLYRAADTNVALVAVSDAQRRDAPDLPWAARIYHGIPADEVRRGAGTRRHVLYLGRISATKGVDAAVSAARSAGRPIVLAGAATIREEVEYFDSTIAPLLGDGVEWVGEVDDAGKDELLDSAGCLLLPLRWHEPFGLVVVEALARGVPVVGFRRAALPEIVDDGVTGVLCESAEELPAAVNRAFELDGAEGIEAVRRRFDARRMAQEHEQLYRRLIASRRSAG